MSDGCSVISVGAAKRILPELALHGLLHDGAQRPVAFQARINGAKDMWVVSDSYDTAHGRDLEEWIEIAESQKKISWRQEDMDDLTCGDSWTFEVVKFTHRLRSSELHIDFLPILEDRGVPRATLEDYVHRQIMLETDQLTACLDDPVSLRVWVHQHFGMTDSANDGRKMASGLPYGACSKVNYLLDHGFTPKTNKFLSDCVRKLADRWLERLRQKMRIPVEKSVSVLGIADPSQCLQPGEIHLVFSEDFHDEKTGESWAVLRKVNAIVARHPTLRPSDMQKVKIVYKPQLAHLKDIVVFPATGRIPLASKLQGGDYDGDTFWVCWEPSFTEQFVNAPVPQQLEPAHFGIEKDSRGLGEMIDLVSLGPHRVDNWLAASFDFKWRRDMLGTITLYHGKLTYARNTLHDPEVQSIADLHDHFVDAAKNGYTFTEASWNAYLGALDLRRDLPKPAYEKAIAGTPDGERPQRLLERIQNNSWRWLDNQRRQSSEKTMHANVRPNETVEGTLEEAISRSDNASDKEDGALRQLEVDDRVILPEQRGSRRDSGEGKVVKPAAHETGRKKNNDHILDYILFEFIDPCLVSVLEHVQSALLVETTSDADLEFALQEWRKFGAKHAKLRSIVLEEERLLIDALNRIKSRWDGFFGPGESKPTAANDAHIRMCYDSYNAIMPQHREFPAIDALCLKSAPYRMSQWDCIKASALATKFHHKQNFMFSIAARELCRLKAESSENTRLLVKHMYDIMKPKKERRAREVRVQALMDAAEDNQGINEEDDDHDNDLDTGGDDAVARGEDEFFDAEE